MRPSITTLFHGRFASSPESFIRLLIFAHSGRHACTSVLTTTSHLSSQKLGHLSSRRLDTRVLTDSNGKATGIHRSTTALAPSSPRRATVRRSTSRALSALSTVVKYNTARRPMGGIAIWRRGGYVTVRRGRGRSSVHRQVHTCTFSLGLPLMQHSVSLLVRRKLSRQ